MFKAGIAIIAAQKHSWATFDSYFFSSFRSKVSWTSSRDNIPKELNAGIKNFFGLDYEELGEAQKKRLDDAQDASMKFRDQPKTGKPRYDPVYGAYEPLPLTAAQILAERAGVTWTPLGHSAIPIPVRALGRGSERFSGSYDNTDIARKLAAAMGIALPSVSEPAVAQREPGVGQSPAGRN